MRHTLLAAVTVIILATLSACAAFVPFAERRLELCPDCTDTEWQVKVEAEKARYDKFIEAERAKSLAEWENSSSSFDARANFAFDYPKCYADNQLQMQRFGVTSQEFLSLCKEYVEDQANKNNAEINTALINLKPSVSTTTYTLPGQRWDNKGSSKTWLTAQSPLWACVDRKRWVWDTIRDEKGKKIRTSIEQGFCTSDANTEGKTFQIKSTLKRYIPPPRNDDASFLGFLESLNPLNILSKCQPVNTAGGVIKGFGLANIGLSACKAVVHMTKENEEDFIGWIEITLDEELVGLCESWNQNSFYPSSVAMGCFGNFLANNKQRDTVFAHTGIRPDNAFGPAGSVSILRSCANRNNWASYGRDATSEEVAFCKTEKTVQDKRSYQIEARQLRVGASQQIKITIGWRKVGKLDLNTNTRIKDVVNVYECGNKSFSRMKNNPRETAVACIEDMLGLTAARRDVLDAKLQNTATHLEALGGYGWTRAQEQKALLGR